MLGNIANPATGKPVQMGAFRKRIIDETFLGALPANLTTTGTVTHSGMPSSVGFMEVATDATSGSVASLSTTFLIPMGQLEAIELTIEGFRLTRNQPNAQVQFALRAAGDHGANLVQDKTTPTAFIQHKGTANTPSKVTIPYDILSGNAQSQKRRSLTWRVLPQLKEAHLYEFNTLIASVPLDPSNGSNITATVSVKTNEAVSHSFQIETLKLYTEHN